MCGRDDRSEISLTHALRGSLLYLGDFETVNANVYAFVIVFRDRLIVEQADYQRQYSAFVSDC